MSLGVSQKMGVLKKAIDALDFLSGIDNVVVTLENGRKEVIDARLELAIPASAPAQVLAALKAPARLAFLSYQTQRALYVVRMAEIDLAKLEGGKQISWRFTWLDIHDKREREIEEKNPSYRRNGNPYMSDALIKAGTAIDDVVEDAKKKLADLRLRYETLRSVRDAAEHRLFVMRKLLSQTGDAAD